MFRYFTILSILIASTAMSQELPCDHPDRIPLEFEVPNIFTPNGDNTNDLFRSKFNVNSFDQYTMHIYNRAGQLIYHADRPAQGWDGRTPVGNNCPEGTYFYVISYQTPCEEDRLAGTLLLQR